jgi:carboxymethylenebutenolidase
MNMTIELSAADGHRFSAYVAEPAATPRGALVVAQEIFGVNSHIRSVADGYAADGYLAIAPALFDRVERGVELGYGEADIQRGFGLKTATGNDKPLLDIEAAMMHVARCGKVGVIGYCWGGLLSWLAACRLHGLAASVPYYGGGVPGQASLAPRCPVMTHFGEQDSHIPLDTVEAFRSAQPSVTIHVYPAQHGFNCDQRGSYDGPSAALARARTVAFLRLHLG